MRREKSRETVDHGLEMLLDYDGKVLILPGGYSMKFSIRRSESSQERPHGLSYSFTLHDRYNHRVLGYDNAHSVRPLGRNKKRPKAHDHQHRTKVDKGVPYDYIDAHTLVQDFFSAVETYLKKYGYELEMLGEEDV